MECNECAVVLKKLKDLYRKEGAGADFTSIIESADGKNLKKNELLRNTIQAISNRAKISLYYTKVETPVDTTTVLQLLDDSTEALKTYFEEGTGNPNGFSAWNLDAESLVTGIEQSTNTDKYLKMMKATTETLHHKSFVIAHRRTFDCDDFLILNQCKRDGQGKIIQPRFRFGGLSFFPSRFVAAAADKQINAEDELVPRVRVSIQTYYKNTKDIHIKVYEKDISPDAAVPDPSLLLFFSVCVMRAMGYDGTANLLASSTMGYDGKADLRASSTTMTKQDKLMHCGKRVTSHAHIGCPLQYSVTNLSQPIAGEKTRSTTPLASSTMEYDGKAQLLGLKPSKEDFAAWKFSQPNAGEETRLVRHYKKMGFKSVKGREKDGAPYMEAGIDDLITKLNDLISKDQSHASGS